MRETMSKISLNKKPNKWLAAILSLVSPPLGVLYAAQLVWAAIYFFAAIAVGILIFFYFRQIPIATIVLSIGFNIVCAVHSYRLASLYPAETLRPHYSRWYGLLGLYSVMFVVVFGFRSFFFEPFRAPAGSMLPTIEIGSYLIVQKWGYGHYGSYGIPPFRNQISAELKRGDIIIFDLPSNKAIQYVKRLVGLPGDTIAYRDKKLSINGKEVPHFIEGDYMTVRAANGAQRLIRYAESLGDGSGYSVVIDEDVNWNITAVPMFVRQEGCIYDDHGEICEIPAGHYFVMGDNRDNSNDSRYWGFVPADHIVGKVLYILR
jgi:signal peptidase I